MFVRLYAPDGGALGGSAAPDAGAPAAGAAGSAAAPGTGAPASPTEAAINAARDRIAQGKPLVEKPVEGAAGDAPGAAAGSEDGSPDGSGAPDPAAADGAAGTEEPTFTLELPADRDGEEAVALELADEETFNRLNRMRNGYMTAQQVKAAKEENGRLREELTELEDMIAVDPTGFMLEHVPETVRLEVAKQLLFDPAVFKALRDTIAVAIEDPTELKVLQAQLKASRLDMRETLRTQNIERKAMQANGQRIAQEVDKLIPETITGSKRDLLFRDAIRDIKERCDRLGLKQVDPRDVVLIVGDRFREYGIDLRATGGEGARPKPAPAPGAKPAAGAGDGERTSQQFRDGSAARRAAAAITPAGVGAPAAKPRPDLPAKQNDGKDTERLIKHMRTKTIRGVLGKT